MKSVVDVTGLPEEFATTLLLLSLIITLAPWLSGMDFGIFKIPQFSSKRLFLFRVIGPICLLVAVAIHLPVFKTAEPSNDIPNNSATTNQTALIVDLKQMEPDAATAILNIVYKQISPRPLENVDSGAPQRDALLGSKRIKNDKTITTDALAYLQTQLALLNNIYSLYVGVWDAAGEYTNGINDTHYNILVAIVRFTQKEMRVILEQNHPLPQLLRKQLANSPLSSADLAVLYDYVNHDAGELSKRLAFLLVLFDPDMPFSTSAREKWLATMREAHKQGVLSLSYAVCEFLLPIDHKELLQLREEFLPGLRAFESDAFDFSLDETQLQQLQIAAQRKRSALGDELAKLVGSMNVNAQVLEARLKDLTQQPNALIGR
jgi:hypothetical protein